MISPDQINHRAQESEVHGLGHRCGPCRGCKPRVKADNLTHQKGGKEDQSESWDNGDGGVGA